MIEEEYRRWSERATLDPDLQAELRAVACDDDAIRDRFYRDLEFGTGGLRERELEGFRSSRLQKVKFVTARRGEDGFVAKASPHCLQKVTFVVDASAKPPRLCFGSASQTSGFARLLP